MPEDVSLESLDVWAWPSDLVQARAIHDAMMEYERHPDIVVGKLLVRHPALNCARCKGDVGTRHLRIAVRPGVITGSVDINVMGECPHCGALCHKRSRLRHHGDELVVQVLHPDRGVVSSTAYAAQ